MERVKFFKRANAGDEKKHLPFGKLIRLLVREDSAVPPGRILNTWIYVYSLLKATLRT